MFDKLYAQEELKMFEPDGINGRYLGWFSKRGVVNEEYFTTETKEHQRTILEFCIEMTR